MRIYNLIEWFTIIIRQYHASNLIVTYPVIPADASNISQTSVIKYHHYNKTFTNPSYELFFISVKI